MKKTKIVATIGPASEKKETLIKMIRAGMNVCRLNFSHGDYSWHKKAIKTIREAEKETRRKIGIMADIQGPRIRVANHKAIKVAEGEEVFLTDERNEKHEKFDKEIVFDWNGFYEHLKTGKKVFIEDGAILLETIKRYPKGNAAKVLVGGVVEPHKGVNIPSVSKHLGFLTEKDLRDLEFIMSQDIDFISASFVANGKDIRDLRRIIDHLKLNDNTELHKIISRSVRKKEKIEKSEPWIISKVERKKAIRNIDSIIRESDGIMVARGDLAIETAQEKVAIYQKNIITKCRKAKKPVIVATQMMASMVESSRPTRAEIADVTNTVIDNADAVMLSGESANGKFPVETVETMKKIVKTVEDSPFNDVKLDKRSKAGREFAKNKEKIKKVKKMETAVVYSSLRQEEFVISLDTKDADLKRKATIVWGVR
jgi:pyruvate kinase